MCFSRMPTPLLPSIIPRPSSLLCYSPELFHPSDNIFRRLDAGRKLRVNDDLRRAHFARCRHVFGNLLACTGKVDAVFLNGSIMNLDVGADDEFQARKARGQLPEPLP